MQTNGERKLKNKKKNLNNKNLMRSCKELMNLSNKEINLRSKFKTRDQEALKTYLKTNPHLIRNRID